MTKRATLLLAALLALAVWGCPRRKPTSADLTHHKVRQLSFWQDRLGRPLEARVDAAPPELAEFIALDNEVNGFDGKTRALPLDPALKGEIAATLAHLPPKLAAKLDKKLLGVFVVAGLGSSAYTEYVRDEKQKPVAAFVVLDADNMGRKANEWITWKERSPFLPDPHWQLEATIEGDAGNTRQGALEFVLIHELGHVLAFNSDVHPLWSVSPKIIEVDDYPFTDVAWTVEGERWKRKLEKTAPLPGPIVYYKPSVERPAGSELPKYYDWLAQSDFVTLYAATNPYDDFAESLVTYVHTVMMGKPFEIRLLKDGVVERRVKACWDEPRCATKRKELEKVLE